MKRTLQEQLGMVLKSVFGTDTECKETLHTTEVLARHAEKKIDGMNAASDRLARFQPASNLADAMRQIVGE